MSRLIKRFVAAHDQARQGIAEFSQACDLGTEVLFQIPKRTLPQNELMWVLLGEVASQIMWCGLKLSSEDYKDIISATLHQQRVVPNADRNGFITLGARTSDMSKAELSDMIEMIYVFGVDNGVKFSEQKVK